MLLLLEIKGSRNRIGTSIGAREEGCFLSRSQTKQIEFPKDHRPAIDFDLVADALAFIMDLCVVSHDIIIILYYIISSSMCIHMSSREPH